MVILIFDLFFINVKFNFLKKLAVNAIYKFLKAQNISINRINK